MILMQGYDTCSAAVWIFNAGYSENVKGEQGRS